MPQKTGGRGGGGRQVWAGGGGTPVFIRREATGCGKNEKRQFGWMIEIEWMRGVATRDACC